MNLITLILGLNLSGITVGAGLETQNTLHEFTLSEEAYTTIRFRNWDGWAYPVRYYQNPKSLTLQWLTFARQDFQFVGAGWRYGAGFGLAFRSDRADIQLVDSSYIPTSRFSFFPVTAIFVQIYSSQTDGLKLLGSLDLSDRFPFSGQVAVLFMIGL